MKITHELRIDKSFVEAHQLIQRLAETDPSLNAWVWMHHPALWQELHCGRCMLKRRSGQDVDFIRQLWSNAVFMRQFHRLAHSLPEDSEKLTRILDEEHAALIGESGALHWVIHDKSRQAVGLLSILDIHTQHKRGEVLVGVLPGHYGVAPAAMLCAAQFFFKVMRFHKLVALVHEDNNLSLQSAKSFGFKLEGVLRDHIWDSTTRRFCNMLELGLLEHDLLQGKKPTLAKRLLSA